MLADLPTLCNDEDIAKGLSNRAPRELKHGGHTIIGLKVVTVFFGSFTKAKERRVRPPIIRTLHELMLVELRTHEEVMAEFKEVAMTKEEADEARAEKAAARTAAKVQLSIPQQSSISGVGSCVSGVVGWQ